ncbi:MAG: hypothetical protein LBS85_08020 [Clostridiales Family XIII bacterium]|jgi:hypothetical protein|nr:hypothetical protein [Clostridiales Family XIII bacterium]
MDDLNGQHDEIRKKIAEMPSETAVFLSTLMQDFEFQSSIILKMQKKITAGERGVTTEYANITRARRETIRSIRQVLSAPLDFAATAIIGDDDDDDPL